MKKFLTVIFTENMSLGASMIAAQAEKHGWAPDILYVPESDGEEVLHNYLDEHRPDLVGVSFKSYERNQAFAAAKISSDMGIKTIAGGIHATFLPQDVARCKGFDAIINGDGMGVMADILDGYKSLEGGRIITGRAHEDKNQYLEYFYSESMKTRMKKTKSILFLTAYGCPYKCAFCCSGRMPFYGYPVSSCVEHMAKLNRLYGVANFQINDEVFASSVERIRKFKTECAKHFPDGIGLSSFVSGRANTFTEEIAAELVSLGITTVGFGIETPSPRLLEFLNKQQTQEDCYRAMAICKKYGLITSVNLLFGLPTQDKEDYDHAYDFVEKAQPDKCAIYYYTPYPGSDCYDYCFDHGLMPDGCTRDNFDWFDADEDGVLNIQVRLKGTDYDFAQGYIDKIQKIMSQKAQVMEKIEIVDEVPWIFVGMSNHYYFRNILRKINKVNWKNFQGYVDLNEMGSYPIDSYIKRYTPASSPEPSLAVTYCFLGGGDHTTVERFVAEKRPDLPIVSVASYKNHSFEEIRKMVDAA